MTKERKVLLVPFGAAAITALMFAAGYAAEKTQKSCEVQLAEHSVRVHHLSNEREEKDKKIAELQTQLYFLNQQKQALEKQLEAAKPKDTEK